MDSDKPLSVRVPKFKGTAERWPAWRDTMEAIMGAYKLINAINNPRPVDAPVVVQAGGGGGGAVVGAGGAGGGDGDGGDAGGGGVVAPPAVPQPPAAVPPGPTSAEIWDEQSAKIYMYLLLHTEDQAQAVVSQFRGTRNGVAAWQALRERYDHQGILGRSLLQRQLMETRFEASTDPTVYFLAIERLTTRLGELGQPVSQEALVGLVLSKLPPSYGPLTTIFDTMEDDLTYDAIKQRVRTFYKRRIAKLDGSDGAEDSTKAFMAGEGRQQRKDQDWKSRVKCFRCKKIGHVKKECPSSKSLESGGAKGGSNKSPAWKGYSKQQNGKGGGRKVRFDPRSSATDGQESEDDEDGNGGRKQSAFTAISKSPFWTDDKEETSCLSFIVDSGATCHMVHDSRHVSNVRYVDKSITVGGGRKLNVIGIGEMAVLAKDMKGNAWPIVIQDVLIVPQLGVNLLSVGKLMQKGAYISFDIEKPHISMGSRRTALRLCDGLYIWMVIPEYRGGDLLPAAYVGVSFDVAHDRLCHRILPDNVKLEELGIRVLHQQRGKDGKCDICEKAKHHHISFPKELDSEGDLKPFEQVYVDYAGPVEEPSIGGARYVVTFVDKATRWMFSYSVEYKSSFLTTLRKYLRDVKALGYKVGELWGQDPDKPYNIWNPDAGPVKGLRSDRGGEFIGEEVLTFCKNAGIKQSFSGPYAPQQQGMSERRNRTLFEMVRAMLFRSKLPKSFWGEALNTAVYISNRLPGAKWNSPYEVIFGKPPKLSNLRVFGCKAYVQTPKVGTKKLDSRAWIGIHVGYDEWNWRCYRIYKPDTNSVRLSLHVTFEESSFPSPEAIMEADELVDMPLVSIPGGGVPPLPAAAHPGDRMDQPAQEEGDDAPGRVPLLPRGTRLVDGAAAGPGGEGRDEAPAVRVPLLPRDANLIDGAAALTIGPLEPFEEVHKGRSYGDMLLALPAGFISDDPKSFKEAMRSEQADDWMEAMKREYNSLMENKTWELVERPKGVNIVGSRWVYTMKRNDAGLPVKPKARFVAKGFSQQFGSDFFETWSPVTRLPSIRCVLSLAAMFDWDCENMDVDTAFLNAPISETIFVEQPEGFVESGPKGEPLVCKMNKSLYGLKQSPRNWNHVIDEWFKEYGFSVSEVDPCLYVKRSEPGRGRSETSILIVLLWVDDLIICGSSSGDIAEFKKAISGRFNMKDLGALSSILGMKIIRDRRARTLEITQTAYVEKVLERFQMDECKPVGTPAEGAMARNKEAGPDREYMSLVGSLLYAAVVTRPDIAYAVQALGRHLQGTMDEHFVAAKRVLRYLKGTKELGLKYGGMTAGKPTVVGYADADWASDKDTRRSVTGYLFMLNGGAISWASKLQPTVALSSSESEYMAACYAAQEAIHLRRLMGSLGFTQEEPTIIYEDNMGCIGMSENPIMHQRSKHIDIRFHFLRETVANGQVLLTFIPTMDQLADLLTKALPKARTQRLRGQVHGYQCA